VTGAPNRFGIRSRRWCSAHLALLRGEPFYDGTVRLLGICITVRNQTRELLSQLLQFADPAVHNLQLRSSKLAGRTAGTASSQSQEVGDLSQGKAHCLGTLNEAQPLSISFGIAPNPADRPLWLGNELAALVVADRLDMHLSGRCESCNGVGLRHDLTPYYGTDLILSWLEKQIEARSESEVEAAMGEKGRVIGAAGGALGLGGLAAALGLCCTVPWAVALLGVTGAVAFARLAFLLPYALIAAVALLGVGFWWAYRPVICADGTCTPTSRRSLQWIVWIAALLVGALSVVALSLQVTQ
jgi:hypothetical protein